jgi:hypothetical protein
MTLYEFIHLSVIQSTDALEVFYTVCISPDFSPPENLSLSSVRPL